MPPQLIPPQLIPPQLMPPQLMPPQLMPPQLMPPQLMPPQLMPAGSVTPAACRSRKFGFVSGVGSAGGREGDGLGDLRHACGWVAADGQGALHEGGFHLAGRVVRVGVEDQRGGAAGDACRHRGAAELEVVTVDDAGRVLGGQHALGAEHGDQVAAWRVELRLGEAVLGRAAARPRGDAVVAEVWRAEIVDRADREHERVVGRRVRDRVAHRARIAGGGDDEDAAEREQFDGGVERVRRVALRRVRPEREVHDADVVEVLVGEDEAKSLDDVADRSEARVVADLDVDQVRLRRDARRTCRPTARRRRRPGRPHVSRARNRRRRPCRPWRMLR